MTSRRTNWAGNVRFGAAERHSPTSIPELQALVARAGLVRAVGGGHSFTDVADTTGALISTLSLPPVLDLDTEGASVRVAAGVTYTDLARYLDRRGFALRNLASLPHLTVGGACATGTHGSGVGNGSLATAVTELELVTADGDLVTVSGPGPVVHLGALGIVTSLTLELVPAFAMRQWVLEKLPLAALVEQLDAVLAAAYSVSVFIDWAPEPVVQVWLKQRVDGPNPPADPPAVQADLPAVRADLPAVRAGLPAVAAGLPVDLPAVPAAGPRHPVGGMPTGNCTAQLGVPGPWYDRLPHFRADAAPSSAGTELQSEYLVGRADAVAALHALAEVRDRIHPVLQTCEIRAVAADELWLSPFHQRDSVGLHFTWVDDEAAVLPVVGLVERQLAPYAPRPHWAKIFTVPPDQVRAGYPRLADFRALVAELDPAGKFGNAFTARYLG